MPTLFYWALSACGTVLLLAIIVMARNYLEAKIHYVYLYQKQEAADKYIFTLVMMNHRPAEIIWYNIIPTGNGVSGSETEAAIKKIVKFFKKEKFKVVEIKGQLEDGRRGSLIKKFHAAKDGRSWDQYSMESWLTDLTI